MWIKIAFVLCCFFMSFKGCSSASRWRLTSSIERDKPPMLIITTTHPEFGSYASNTPPPIITDKEYADYIVTGYGSVASRERRKGMISETTGVDEPRRFTNPFDDYGQTLKRPRRHTDSIYTHQANIALRLKAASLKRRFLHRILSQNQRTPLYIRRMLAKFRLSRN